MPLNSDYKIIQLKRENQPFWYDQLYSINIEPQIKDTKDTVRSASYLGLIEIEKEGSMTTYLDEKRHDVF